MLIAKNISHLNGEQGKDVQEQISSFSWLQGFPVLQNNNLETIYVTRKIIYKTFWEKLKSS